MCEIWYFFDCVAIQNQEKGFDSLIFRFQSTAYTDIREGVSNLNAKFQHHFKDFSIYNMIRYTLFMYDKGIHSAVRLT